MLGRVDLSPPSGLGGSALTPAAGVGWQEGTEPLTQEEQILWT